ncbi:MAG TPA: hypothetical protein DDY12_02735 [Porphyromonadaceae bacterium]|nr:hypothetical protein [Porphyromonadaceae bacterium]
MIVPVPANTGILSRWLNYIITVGNNNDTHIILKKLCHLLFFVASIPELTLCCYTKKAQDDVLVYLQEASPNA